MKKLLKLCFALALCIVFTLPALADVPTAFDGSTAGIPGLSQLPTMPTGYSSGETPAAVSNMPTEIPGMSTYGDGLPHYPGTPDITVPPGTPTVTMPDFGDALIPGGFEFPSIPEIPPATFGSVTPAPSDTALPSAAETPDPPDTALPPAIETPAPPVSSTGFLDVPVGYYCEPAIQWMVDLGIASGVDDYYFAPDRTCNVAEVLTFLWHAKGSPEPVIYDSLSWLDDPSLDYYKPVMWAYSIGLIRDTSTDPALPCTRAMAMTYLWKLDGAKQIGNSGFTDVPLNADYAQAVAWATLHNITGGTSVTQFSPNLACTRGQIATFLYRNFALQ